MFGRVGFTVEEGAALSALASRGQFNVIDFSRGYKVDLIVRKDRDFSVAEFDRRQTHEVEGMRLTLATPEDVVIAKLEWARIGGSNVQISDAAGILATQADDLDVTYIETWVERLGLEAQWRAAKAQAG